MRRWGSLGWLILCSNPAAEDISPFDPPPNKTEAQSPMKTAEEKKKPKEPKKPIQKPGFIGDRRRLCSPPIGKHGGVAAPGAGAGGSRHLART